jgi:predicted neuraminidase
MIQLMFLLSMLSVSLVIIFIRPQPTSWQIETSAVKNSPQTSAAQYLSTHLPTTELANHASSILALADGTRMAVWFAGSREGASDVKLLLALYKNATWSAPQAIQSVANNIKAFGHYTKKIGNPVLFEGHDGKIHLLFVTVALGGWGGSRVAHSVSTDQGQSWSSPVLWVTSPFINISTQLRHPPLPVKLDDGNAGWLLPAHHEFMQKFPEYLVLDSAGNFLHKQRLPFGSGLIQPAFVGQDQAQLDVFFRPTNQQKQILFSTFQNAWDTSLQSTALPNPDAGIAVAKWGDKLLLAYNPSSENRNKLALAVKDKNSAWRAIAEIESGVEYSEFSYPSLAVQGDAIDLTYSYQRQFIKHARFNAAWLEQQLLASK